MYTVRQARLLSGNTQRNVAKLTGISLSTYKRFEKHPDTATVQFAKRFSQVTKLPLDRIFFARNST